MIRPAATGELTPALAKLLGGLWFKVWTPRPRIFATMEQATAAAEDYRKRTGVFVCITEHPRRA